MLNLETVELLRGSDYTRNEIAGLAEQQYGDVYNVLTCTACRNVDNYKLN